MRTLDALYRAYRHDSNFAHLRDGARFVPGVGSEHPRVVFIGEAPGRAENLAGAPFVGPSGKVLDGCLREIGLSREDVFITNVVKYRPPGNRTPTDEEIDAAREYLRKELSILRGNVAQAGQRATLPVVLLGATALALVMRGEGIGRWRGKVIPRGSYRFLPMYHPAAVLRNRKLSGTMHQDFYTLRDELLS